MWNPSLEQSTGSPGSIAPTPTGGNQYGYPCTLQTSLSYCMQLFSPTPGNSCIESFPDVTFADMTSSYIDVRAPQPACVG